MVFLRAQVGPTLAVLQAEKDKKSRRMHSDLVDTLMVCKWPDHIFPDFPVDPVTVQRGTQP